MTNCNNINHSFIHYIAPTLCGIKPANLFMLSKNDVSPLSIMRWKHRLNNQNLKMESIKNESDRIMIFSYDLVWIRQILSDVLVQAYLLGKGYSNPLDTTGTLKELFFRLSKQNGFPHEVGIFLGYPFEDVIAFEKNQGHNCKYCGYWKSYCNPEQAKKSCSQYKQCSQMCKQWFEEGFSIPQIIKKFKEAVDTAA